MSNSLSCMPAGVDSFSPGQKVQTSFGLGIVSAISYIDAIVYVALSNESTALHIFRPEQIEAIDIEYA